MTEFILKDWYGKEKSFDHETVYFQDAEGNLLPFTHGTGNPTLEDLKVTENGNYTPSEGVDGFGSVTVNVPDIPAVVQPLEVTENGTYTAPDGVDGYSPVVVNVATASADLKYVTFMSYDGLIEYGKKAVAVGDDCADPIARGVFSTPTRESDVQYNYTFYGWATEPNIGANSNWNKAVTEDKTVYANFTKTVRSYTITFCDEDGTVLTTKSVAYGSMPSYTPTKDDYDFAGWQPKLTAVVGNATYTATWTPKPEMIAEGTCGDNAKWMVTTDGRLIISGTGAMYDYAQYPSDGTRMPWIDHRSTGAITSIEIQEGITYIGTYCFYYHETATSVYIPSTVTTIGKGAFGYCKAMTNIDLACVQSIGYRAFEYCKALTSITIPASVNAIANYAFYSSALTSAVFEDTEGWYSTYSEGATSGTALDVTDPAAIAKKMRQDSPGYWYKS